MRGQEDMDQQEHEEESELEEGSNPLSNQSATEWVDWASSPFTPEIPNFEGAPGPTIPPKNTQDEYVEEFLIG